MFSQKQILPLLSLVAICGAIFVGCVDIPTDAPPLPTFNSEFRFLSLNPAAVGAPASVPFAEGVDGNYQLSKVFSSLAIGSNAAETGFSTFSAGTKRFIYVNDTISVSFETDQRATLVFYRNNWPDADTAHAHYFYMKVPIRNLYTSSSAIGKSTSTSVRFVNLVNGGLDTLSVWKDSLKAGTAAANVAYGKVSALQEVLTGKTVNYFIARSLAAGKNRVFKDSLTITGSSNQVLSVYVYDTYDTTKVVADSLKRGALVQVKKLIEN